MNFETFFSKATQHPAPRKWQLELANDSSIRSRLIRRVTGDGKTEGVLCAWLWNAVLSKQGRAKPWPRRLVWCLPMRVLVEQTVASANALCATLPEEQRPRVAVLMGGEDIEEWFLEPDRPWILIGTQDMLLSRAMNRGYGTGRARWPIEFGLLNQDALWIMDEVQLMDVGLATSVQLQAYRDADDGKALWPAYTWWMSATLQRDWLRTVDTEERWNSWVSEPSVATSDERTSGLWEVTKSVTVDAIGAGDDRAFADCVLSEHDQLAAGEFGKITLVVCNTVDRAVETYDALQRAGRTDGLELVHSRFRQHERRRWRESFLSRAACTQDVDRIVVATQVVEAGVDISAGCLITELAPWPSLVQRFGRCARYGGTGRVLVVDRGHDEKLSAPYQPEELASTLAAVRQLNDVGIRSLEEFEEQLDDDARAEFYPYEPQHLLMRHEFDELFDTTPDLTGADLDISRFIRFGDERDVQVFWIDLETKQQPGAMHRPQRAELCSIPFLKACEWLCGKETKSNPKPRLRGGTRAWVWDWLDGEWQEVRRADILPGRLIAVTADCGGYTIERGFSPDSSVPVSVVPHVSHADEERRVDAADQQHDGEQLSYSEWKSIAFHTDEVVESAVGLSERLELSDRLQRVLRIAARWHDIGKAHPAFQGAIEDAADEPRPDRPDLAKGPRSAWRRRGAKMYRFAVDTDNEVYEYRLGLRHELASALGLFSVLEIYKPDHAALLGPWGEILNQLKPTRRAVPNDPIEWPTPTAEIQELLDCSADEFDLVAYLVASHHGKVRVALHASPGDQDFPLNSGDDRGLPIRGVRNRDVLPAIPLMTNGAVQPQLELTLEPAAMGLSTRTGVSWRERSQRLIERHGPAALATLEAVLRAADVEASRRTTEDPALRMEVTT